MATEHRPRVLVVDDMVDAADSLAAILRLWGYDVIVAYRGSTAVEAAGAYEPQVVLVDVAMPGMDGFRLAELLRQQAGGANALVIGITGHGEEAHRARGREVGFAGYFVKPVDLGLLQNLLSRLVGRPQLSSRQTGGQATIDVVPDGLRVDRPAPGSRPGANRATRPPGVLVVDDDDFVRDMLDISLRQEGFAVWPAASGLEALELYRRRRGEIDAVVLDVCMPGLDGPQTLAALRSVDPGVRCCFLSGGLGRYTEGDLRKAGAAAVMSKPPRLPEVARLLRRLAGADPPGGRTTRRSNETEFASKGWAGGWDPQRPSDSPAP